MLNTNQSINKKHHFFKFYQNKTLLKKTHIKKTSQ